MTEQRKYSDFDLLIEPTGGEGYRAKVVASPAGEATGSFALPFSDLELVRLTALRCRVQG